MPTSALKLRQITKFGQNGTVVANISYDCRHASEEGARVALVGPQEPLDRADTEVEEVVLIKKDKLQHWC